MTASVGEPGDEPGDEPAGETAGETAGPVARARSGVEFGIYLPQVALAFEAMVERALECERLGLDSLWLFDHLYTPGAPAAPSFEGWTLAAALLARTSRLRLGHLVTCNTFRHPALLGKMATSVDVMSGGRLEFGIGSGSYEQEHHEAGLPWGTPGERADRLEEALAIITRMFEQPVTTYSGRYYEVRDLPNVPQPVQRPRPPVHVGGAGPKRTLPLVARYADVWNVPTYALDRLPGLNREMDAACERVGRDPASLRRSVEAVLVVAEEGRVDEAVALARRRYGQPGYGLDAGGFTGTPAHVVDRIGQLVDAGFTSFVFLTPDRAATRTLELLATEVLPHFPRPATRRTAVWPPATRS